MPDRRNLPLVLVSVAVMPAMGYLSVNLPKLAVQMVTDGVEMWRLLAGVIGICVLMLLVRIANCLTMPLKNQCLRLRHILEEKVLQQLCATDYANLEDPAYRAKIERAKELYHHWSRDVCECVESSVSFAADVLSFLVYGGILVTLHSLVVVWMVVCVLVQQCASRYQVKWVKKNRVHWESLERKIDYISGTTCDFASAKDQRLYATDEWLLPKCRGLMDERMKWNHRELRQKLAIGLIVRGAFLLQQALIYYILIRGVLSGQIEPASFTLYVGAALRMSSTIFRLGGEIGILRENAVSIADYRDILEEGRAEADAASSAQHLMREEAGRKAPSITFSDVSFSYPGAEKETLKKIHLTIRAGERIAIVGLNGAGKTTLVKLLCGMYKPTKGQIRIDGIPNDRWEPDDYFRMFSVAFQDYVVMPGTIAENVAGCGADGIDRERVQQSLRQADLWDVVEKMPEGMDTCVPKAMFANGRSLSGGETQKLLLARAVYRDAPILILDEPTAALDPIAENKLYLAYGSLTENRTSVYISHRLASTRFCDRILMMEDGKIIEEGSHEELMEKQGAYYRLYEIQSHYYQNDRSEEFSSEQDPSWEVSGYVSV